jgi:hypothetical protein
MNAQLAKPPIRPRSITPTRVRLSGSSSAKTCLPVCRVQMRRFVSRLRTRRRRTRRQPILRVRRVSKRPSWMICAPRVLVLRRCWRRRRSWRRRAVPTRRRYSDRCHRVAGSRYDARTGGDQRGARCRTCYLAIALARQAPVWVGWRRRPRACRPSLGGISSVGGRCHSLVSRGLARAPWLGSSPV